MSKRIGIYSGSFDPIHDGHLAFAQEALKICNLNEVIFLPEQAPRDKPNVTKIDERIDLIAAKIITIPNLSVLQLRTAQFNVAETLPILQTKFPDSEFTLLVGSDVVRTFEYRWEDLNILLSSVSLAIGMRTGDDSVEIEDILFELEKDFKSAISYTLIYTDHSHIASSHIRKNRLN